MHSSVEEKHNTAYFSKGIYLAVSKIIEVSVKKNIEMVSKYIN